MRDVKLRNTDTKFEDNEKKHNEFATKNIKSVFKTFSPQPFLFHLIFH